MGPQYQSVFSSLFRLHTLKVYTLNFIAYTLFLGFVLYQGFKTLRGNVKHGDRTGLVTVHPELFDEKGNIAEKEFLVVKFKRSKPTLP